LRCEGKRGDGRIRDFTFSRKRRKRQKGKTPDGFKLIVTCETIAPDARYHFCAKSRAKE
jgi:hypothetical protein